MSNHSDIIMWKNNVVVCIKPSEKRYSDRDMVDLIILILILCMAKFNNFTTRKCRQLKTLEKVLLDPIFMILRCELFTHFGSCFLKLHDMSTSQLEALVM